MVALEQNGGHVPFPRSYDSQFA